MTKLHLSKQLALEIDNPTVSEFTTFYFDPETSVGQALQNWLQAPYKESFFYLWGNTGTGKTHLLKACCHLAKRLGWQVAYLPLKLLTPLPEEIWEGLEHYDLVAIDDCEYASCHPHHAEKLLALYENTSQQHARLLFSANCSPYQLPSALPDLTSRLCMAMIFQLTALDDEKKIKALQLHAKIRDLKLSTSVAHYILNHCPRDMASLMEIFDFLCKITLQKKKMLSIPFLSAIFHSAEFSNKFTTHRIITE